MHELIPVWMALAAAAMLLLVSMLIATILFHAKHNQTRHRLARTEAMLEAERAAHAEKLAAYQQARDQLADTFYSLAGQALNTNNEAFLKLAQENLKQLHIQAASELAQREKAVENIIAPIKETLDKAERELRRMENERKEAYGSLHKHLETMAHTQQQLHTETRNLVQALRRPEVRGRWGELTLKRLVELAGMVEHCDFIEQLSSQTDGKTIRPDMIVRLPAGREIVVDVKTPLDAYLSALEAKDDGERQKELVKHAAQIRTRIKELAAKAYWSQFKQSPDFVILFIPGEQFLGAALDIDQSLLEYALQQKIILATPSSFIAVLRAVAFGWRQQQLTENAEHIRAIGEELYKRLFTFTDHLARLGKALSQSGDFYNKAMGSLQRQVLPSARKFTELGISEQPLPEWEEVDTDLRAVVSNAHESGKQ